MHLALAMGVVSAFLVSETWKPPSPLSRSCLRSGVSARPAVGKLVHKRGAWFSWVQEHSGHLLWNVGCRWAPGRLAGQGRAVCSAKCRPRGRGIQN